jgi:hypothetical protein
MAGPPIRCVELVETATDWMENALSEDARVGLEEHIAICPHCTDYVVQLRASIVVLRDAPRPAPPPAAREALLDAFRRSRPE